MHYINYRKKIASSKMQIEDLLKGKKIPGNAGPAPDKPPKWLDKEKFQRGQLFFQKHMIAFLNMLYQYLMLGFSLRTLSEPLIYTKKSDTASKSSKRYMQTFDYLLVWHTGDVWKPGSLAYESVQNVRKMHKKTSQAMNSKNNGQRESTTESDYHYFSQYDMAIVQFAFVSGVVLYPEQFGVDCSESELEDYIHFWRGIGYLLGIEDKFNMCRGNYTETLQICQDIEEHVLPELKSPTKESQVLVQAFCDGINLTFKVPISSVASVYAFFHYYLNSAFPVFCLGLADWLRVYFLRFIAFLCWWFPFLEIFIVQQVLKSFYKDLAKRKPNPKEETSQERIQDFPNGEGGRKAGHA